MIYRSFTNLSFFLIQVNAALSSTPLRAPSYPLAVRSPYLSTWVRGSSTDGIVSVKPEFWTGQGIGWTGLARVDNVTYSILGEPVGNTMRASAVKQSFGPSYSEFTFAIGKALLVTKFINPITPSDFKRQSIPLSYLEVTILPSTCASDVEIYFDV